MFSFDFRPYRRPFLRPLETHHGLWSDREGIIIRLRPSPATDTSTPQLQESLLSRQGAFGEIAPVPWFGSETLEQAIAFCAPCLDS